MTLLQQWALAAVLAIIPLLAAVSYAVLSLEQQTREQRALVQELDSLSTHTAALLENLRELVRAARQYQLLQDQAFLEQYRQKNTALGTLAAQLQDALPAATAVANGEEGHGSLARIIGHLVNIQSTAAEVGELLVSEVSGEVLAARSQTLVSAADELVNDGNLYRQQALQRGEAEFNRIVDQLYLLAVLALPGTILMMVIGSFMVSRPIWRLSQAIKGFGRHQWDQPVRIEGPADLVALGENLEWMRLQVLASDRQKTAFIQHVTHELKTPLAAIIEAASLLDDGVGGPLGDDQQAVLDILRGNARHLGELIQQLLNYNAVSHGMMTHAATVNVRQLCEIIRRDLETASPDKGPQWHLDGEPDTLHCDARLLEMILRNLVGNAFRFSPDGGRIEVSWSCAERHWRLEVADRGPGIDADELETIFTPFYRGRASRQDTAPRNGIGLAIVDEAVKLLHGRIEVWSNPGQGARFCLECPHPQQEPA
ncbi:MAG: HAMP domain-containing histidine kinase [Bacteroidales bacterium]|nr:HAMP domain-containing histidine kinase [Bacteroidales bacterium]